MKKWIAGVMLLGAAGFVAYAFRHPELQWLWDSGASYGICGSCIAVMLILFAMPNRK